MARQHARKARNRPQLAKKGVRFGKLIHSRHPDKNIKARKQPSPAFSDGKKSLLHKLWFSKKENSTWNWQESESPKKLNMSTLMEETRHRVDEMQSDMDERMKSVQAIGSRIKTMENLENKIRAMQDIEKNISAMHQDVDQKIKGLQDMDAKIKSMENMQKKLVAMDDLEARISGFKTETDQKIASIQAATQNIQNMIMEIAFESRKQSAIIQNSKILPTDTSSRLRTVNAQVHTDEKKKNRKNDIAQNDSASPEISVFGVRDTSSKSQEAIEPKKEMTGPKPGNNSLPIETAEKKQIFNVVYEDTSKHENKKNQKPQKAKKQKKAVEAMPVPENRQETYVGGEDEENIKTSLDVLYDLIMQTGAIKVPEAARRLHVSDKQVEEWSRVLEKHGLIDLHYPTFGKPTLKKKTGASDDQ